MLIASHNISIFLGAFYYTLGNIEPRYRSALHMIQLVCLAKSKLIDEYGVDEVLKPFVESIQKLEKVQFFGPCMGE